MATANENSSICGINWEPSCFYERVREVVKLAINCARADAERRLGLIRVPGRRVAEQVPGDLSGYLPKSIHLGMPSQTRLPSKS
jgi:hypothetical protein